MALHSTLTGRETLIDHRVVATSSLQYNATGNARGWISTDLQAVRAANNQVASGTASVIGGGRDNRAAGVYSSICAGYQHTALGSFTSIVGGRGNLIDARVAYGTIGGGKSNTITHDATHSSNLGVIAGGRDNKIGEIDGDIFETHSLYSTISGGRGNELTGNNNTISGGQQHTIKSATNNATSSCTIGGGNTNTIEKPRSTISGGQSNIITEADGVIGGGLWCTINSRFGTIGGGFANKIWSANLAQSATISGGIRHIIDAHPTKHSHYTTIGGGFLNRIGYSSQAYDCDYSTIAGGRNIRITGKHDVVGGGLDNYIWRCDNAMLGGGRVNRIVNLSHYSVLCGGETNSMDDAEHGFIGGGRANSIQTGTATRGTIAVDYCTITGGSLNKIGSFNNKALLWGSTICGGLENVIDNTVNTGSNYNCTIGGGYQNVIGNTSKVSVIAGGEENKIANGSNESKNGFIGGGKANRIGLGDSDTNFAVIGGGQSNIAQDSWATVAGGASNVCKGDYGSIGGGQLGNIQSTHGHIGGGLWNRVSQDYGIVAGGERNKLNADGGSGHSAIGGGRLNEADGTYSTIPGGYEAKTVHYGEFAHANGSFTTAGDAQTMEMILWADIDTGDSWETLYLDGPGATHEITIPDKCVYAFEMIVAFVKYNGGTTETHNTVSTRICASRLYRGSVSCDYQTPNLIDGTEISLGNTISSADYHIRIPAALTSDNKIKVEAIIPSGHEARVVVTVRITKVIGEY